MDEKMKRMLEQSKALVDGLPDGFKKRLLQFANTEILNSLNAVKALEHADFLGQEAGIEQILQVTKDVIALEELKNIALKL